MWRLWAKGFGVRDWWYWWRHRWFPVWAAWAMPRWLAYWAYIRVYSASNEGLSEESRRTMRAWELGAGR